MFHPNKRTTKMGRCRSLNEYWSPSIVAWAMSYCFDFPSENGKIRGLIFCCHPLWLTRFPSTFWCIFSFSRLLIFTLFLAPCKKRLRSHHGGNENWSQRKLDKIKRWENSISSFPSTYFLSVNSIGIRASFFSFVFCTWSPFRIGRLGIIPFI